MKPGLSAGALEQFVKELETVGTQLHALEIWQHEKPLLRWAMAPYRCSDRREVYSLSKSFTSTAVGLAYDRGLLHPDDLLSRYFPQQVAAQPDERWQRVRLRHLLTMTVGHGACPMQRMVFSPDAVASFFATPLEYEPGTHFAYSTGATCMLAEVVRRATGYTVPDLLAQELMEPMGIEQFSWDVCVDGRCQGGTGLKASCDDVAKLGMLYCAGGMWRGKRLLSQDWVEMATRLQASNGGNGTPDWCAGYGFQFWKNKNEGFRGDGACGQLCVVLPRRGLSVAVFAESANMSAELDALWRLLDGLWEDKPGTGLPQEYAPCLPAAQGNKDTGWLRCGENAMGFTRLRARQTDGALELTVCDGRQMQLVRARPGVWTENCLWARNMRPMLYRQMTRTECVPLRFAAAAAQQGDTMVLECRSLDTAHTFCWKLIPCGDGLQLRLTSPLDVIGASGAWEAHP